MSLLAPSHSLRPAGQAAAAQRQPGFAARWQDWLAARLDEEHGRWFLWLPVYCGAGIAAYFALAAEPAGILAFAIVLGAAALRIFLRFTLFGFLAGSIILAVAAGFGAAKLRTWSISAPLLEHQGVYDVTGFIESYERRTAKRGRAVLRVHTLSRDGNALAEPPYRVRLLVNGETDPVPGSAVKLRAMLSPPPGPVQPGATIPPARFTFRASARPATASPSPRPWKVWSRLSTWPCAAR